MSSIVQILENKNLDMNIIQNIFSYKDEYKVEFNKVLKELEMEFSCHVCGIPLIDGTTKCSRKCYLIAKDTNYCMYYYKYGIICPFC